MTGGTVAAAAAVVTAIRLLTTDQSGNPSRTEQNAHPRTGGPDRAADSQDESVEHDDHDPARLNRMAEAVKIIENGSTITGERSHRPRTSSAAFANATGCGSVYASTFPFNAFSDPGSTVCSRIGTSWRKGIFEGISAPMQWKEPGHPLRQTGPGNILTIR